ncbi:MAG: RecB-like helicase [Epsilonproteobacteria bacterium]|nr:MAG: RecB-like helicase [Campylobacterota bacterium]
MQPFLALKASAGSGKTFALTVRYISLLLLDANPKEILTLTFTNKAAAQMAQRIYDTLISLGEDDAILDAISKETNLTKNEILDKKQDLIQNFISSELSIYTIDKFINKILREFAGYIGINDDFDIKFDDEELLLYKFLTSLDEKQFDTLISFAHNENKKLNSIVELFKVLIDKNEYLEVQSYPSGSYDAVKIAIMEDANIIKKFIDSSAVSKSGYSAVDFTNIEQLLSKGKTWLTKESLSEFTYFKKAKPPQELDIHLENIQKNITLYYQIQESYTLKSLFNIFEDFKSFRNRYNTQRNALEFSDITNIVSKLLSNHIEKDFLYFRLDSKYNHILIDEFQDTSTLQFKILDHLIDEIISGDPEVFKTFFYVGDIKQSIYRFRGGTKELFDFVSKVYDPMLKVELLDTNYRSSKSVVEFVNSKFNDIKDYEYDNQKVNSKIEGFVEVVPLSSDIEILYEDIYKKVDELLKENINPNNIAILTYTNADVLAVYEYLKLKIPTLDIVTEMTSKLINQQNVKAVINAVKYLYFQEKIYKVNFNSLIGRDYEDEFDFFIDIKTNDIVTVVKKLSYYFDIVDDDVIRLIELTKSYDSIVDFVYDIDKEDSSMLSQNKSGLSILTIFKSKGLEFDTVLVLDRIKRKNADRSTLLFEYDDIKLEQIYYKRSKREDFDNHYKASLEKEKKLVIGDELNILYVSLTRAKNNMIVFKKEKSSVFDILGDFPIGKIGSLYISLKKEKEKTINQSISYTPLNFGYQEKEKNSDKNQDNLKARYFGIATHFCLEMMKDFTKNSLEKAMIMCENKYNNLLTTNEFEDINARINNLINNNTFISILENGSFTKEQSLMFNGEHKILDLLIKKDDGYIVVDYKTTVEKSLSHIKQVQNYKNAIKDITNMKNIKGYVVYLHFKNIEIIEV